MGKIYDRLAQDYRVKEGLKACISCGTCAASCPVEAISQGDAQYDHYDAQYDLRDLHLSVLLFPHEERFDPDGQLFGQPRHAHGSVIHIGDETGQRVPERCLRLLPAGQGQHQPDVLLPFPQPKHGLRRQRIEADGAAGEERALSLRAGLRERAVQQRRQSPPVLQGNEPVAGKAQGLLRRKIKTGGIRGQVSIFSTAINASLGTWTVPNWRMRFFPSFCFSRSFFFRVMSPP